MKEFPEHGGRQEGEQQQSKELEPLPLRIPQCRDRPAGYKDSQSPAQSFQHLFHPLAIKSQDGKDRPELNDNVVRVHGVVFNHESAQGAARFTELRHTQGVAGKDQVSCGRDGQIFRDAFDNSQDRGLPYGDFFLGCGRGRGGGGSGKGA
ncbi:MAG: hypothetical protein A4E74_02525 [Syntrophus sp. PtaB.Bin075]|nr:MAG: hypothetical protein A4E74_02525 [Syntrophus sp. PtaB.Bin075]